MDRPALRAMASRVDNSRRSGRNTVIGAADSPFQDVAAGQGTIQGEAMRRIWIAIRALFAVLFSGDLARHVERLLRGEAEPNAAAPMAAAGAQAKPPPPAPKTPAKAVRSDAVTLLATLQREARFVDFIEESLEDYSDEQVGAAARDVHRQCRAVVERMFGLRPVVSDAEGAAIDVPPGFDAGKYRLTGKVAGQAPFRGQLAHHGWQVDRCDVPSWSGGKDAAMIVAPAEVEVK